MSTHKLLAPRRIGVCGSSRGLSSEAIQFCKFVGERLASYPTVCVVSGGTRKSSKASEDDLAADWYLVRAAESSIAPDALIDRIETVLTEGWRADLSFAVGKTQRARGKTGEARRFSFVRGLDGLIAIGGGSGTAQELALAHELGIRVLPVPWFPGEAAEFWKAYREDLITGLRLDPARASEWEELIGLNADRLRSIASEMVDTLVASLSRRCFVVMPFDEDFGALFDFVIEPAIEACGDEPIRLDRASIPGDVGRQISDGIKMCDYTIVVLDGLRPNVLYEMGLAHGRGKPTILINKTGSLGRNAMVPFDIAMQQRVEYKTLDNSLVDRVRETIVNLSVLST